MVPAATGFGWAHRLCGHGSAAFANPLPTYP
jgi:hypothetical protein